MSEAIGALGTAVGVISLGIQVCQGLYKYVDAVQSRDKDLDETAQQVQRLTQILAALAALIPRIASLPNKNSGAIQALESCIKGSHDSVLVLQKLHQSLERRPSSLAKDKAKEIGRHLAFPFLKSEFASVRENVSSLGANTALALQVIQSNLGIVVAEDVMRIAESLQGETTNRLRDIATNTEANLKKSMVVEEHMIASREIMERIDAKIDRSLIIKREEEAQYQQESAVTQIMMEMRAGFQALEESIKDVRDDTASSRQSAMHVDLDRKISQLQLRVLEKPSALRELCDIADLASSPAGPPNNSLISPLDNTYVCMCNVGRKQRTLCHSLNYNNWRWWGWGKYSEERSRHTSGCVLYNTQKQYRSGVRLKLAVSGTLGYLIDISVAHSFGAGGCSISPNLSVVSLVEYCPAIPLVSDFYSSFLREGCTYEEMESEIARVTRQISILFQTRQSSPNFRYKGGMSLIQYGVSQARSNLKWRPMVPHMLRHINNFNQELIRLGIAFEDTDHVNSPLASSLELCLSLTKYDTLWELNAVDFLQMYPTLITIDDIVAGDTAKRLTGLLHLNFGDPRVRQAFDLHPLHLSILSQDEGQLYSQIAAAPHVLLAHTKGLTCLHLSATWPAGTEILLSCGALKLINDKLVYEDATALDVAIGLHRHEVVRVLLDHGALWQGFDRYYLPPETCTEAMVRTIARNMASRRWQLFDLARATLPEAEMRTVAYRLQNDDNDMDTVAPLLMHYLHGRAIRVPGHLRVSSTYKTIYFDLCIPLSYVPVFYQEGFTQVNTRNEHGLSLSMFAYKGPHTTRRRSKSDDAHMSLLDLLRWFSSHGCLGISPTDPDSIGVNTSATGWHYMATEILFEHHGLGLWVPTFSMLAVFGEVMGASVTDCCQCWCSSDGCTPLHQFLKDQCGPEAWKYHEGRGSQLLVDAPSSSPSPTAQMVDTTLRFLTFEALEMTHTCCSAERRGHARVIMNFRGDADDIREEEQELGRRLESLSFEFQSHFAVAGESLADFLRGYWAQRMAQECVPGVGDREALENTEVIYDETYQTPKRLKMLFDWEFDLQDFCHPEGTLFGAAEVPLS